MTGVMSVREVVETHTSSTIDHRSSLMRLGLKCFVRHDPLICRLGQSTIWVCLFKTSTLPNGNLFYCKPLPQTHSRGQYRWGSRSKCSQRRQEGIRNISCFSLYKLVRMNPLKSPGSPARMDDRLLLKSTRSYHHSRQKCDPR